jgi:hypothetical protein
MKNKISSIATFLTVCGFIAFVATAHADKGGGSANRGPNTNNAVNPNRGPNTNNVCNQGPNTNNVPNPNRGPNTNNVANDEVKIRLVPPTGVKAEGSADFRSEVGHVKFEVEAEVPGDAAGTVLTVSVDTVTVGTITLGATGEGELEIEAEHGATVPAIVPGSVVMVTDPAGDLILAGQF